MGHGAGENENLKLYFMWPSRECFSCISINLVFAQTEHTLKLFSNSWAIAQTLTWGIQSSIEITLFVELNQYKTQNHGQNGLSQNLIVKKLLLDLA